MTIIVDGVKMGIGATIEIAELEALAKGTIIAGDGSGAPALVAVGVDNAILQPDSTKAAGCAWRTEVGIGIAPVSGCRITLPQENDAVTPTLAFGDGDTGFYESVDDSLRVAVGGSGRFLWVGESFRSLNNNGPSMQNFAASDIVPTLLPDISDVNTGIGQAAEDQLSLIVGSIEGIRITEVAAVVTVDVKCTPGTSVGGFPSGGLHVTSPSTSANANAVITGHNLNAGNKQLWYLGSTSGSNDRIGLINRQNADLTLHTNNVERLRIEPGGNVVIGASTARGQLEVKQSSGTGAEPVLFLDQQDISEEMMELNSTIGVGNAIEAVGAKALIVTEFVKVTINGNTRYLQVGTIA